MSQILSWTITLLSLDSLAVIVECQNIDTQQPILRQIRTIEDLSHFGYTVALHQTNINPGTMTEAVEGAR